MLFHPSINKKKLNKCLFLGDLDLWQHIYGIDHIYGRESGLRKSIVNSQRRRLLQTPGLVQRSPPPEAAEPRADRTPHPEYMWLQSAPTRQWALQSSHLYTQNWIIEQRGRTHTLSGVQAKLIKNTYQDQSHWLCIMITFCYITGCRRLKSFKSVLEAIY